MLNLYWNYIELTRFHHSYARRTVTNFHPAILDVLAACPGSTICGNGRHSVVIQISPDVVAKVPLEAGDTLETGDTHLLHEQGVLEAAQEKEEYERRKPCPFVVQRLFRGGDITFLEYLPNGTLHECLNRDRASWFGRPRPVVMWMLQLATAAAHLESVGFAHGNICPEHILFDNLDHARLVNFGLARRVGDDLEVGYEPYVRQHRGRQGGKYGVAGPATEQFALGSIFWYMTRGSEVRNKLGTDERVDRPLDEQFPATDPHDPIDKVIDGCWNGRYATIALLVDDIKRLPLPGGRTQMQRALHRRRQRERHAHIGADCLREIRSTWRLGKIKKLEEAIEAKITWIASTRRQVHDALKTARDLMSELCASQSQEKSQIERGVVSIEEQVDKHLAVIDGMQAAIEKADAELEKLKDEKKRQEDLRQLGY